MSAPAVFPAAATLLSRALWYALDHPGPVLGLGLAGSALPAALFLLFLREAQETLFFAGSTAETMKPVALGLAAVYFLRFPSRLALARWMAAARRGRPESLWGASRFALLHLPSALFYGSLSTLGWIAGAVLIVPLAAVWYAGLAFHTFAASDVTSARDALREVRRIPLGTLGLRLMNVTGVVVLTGFLILWSAPQALLGLAEWLARADVSALRAVVGSTSALWAGTALVLALVLAELLWSVAFGLLAGEWETVSRGADLARELAHLESRLADAEVFA